MALPAPTGHAQGSLQSIDQHVIGKWLPPAIKARQLDGMTLEPGTEPSGPHPTAIHMGR